MRNIFIFGKVKLAILFFVMFAISVFAAADNLNFYGQLGYHKTQSAQTLGHGRFGVGLFGEGTGLNSIIQGDRFCAPMSDKYQYAANLAVTYDESCKVDLGSYIGINLYPFVSLGLSNYFDFGISIPVYTEMIEIQNKNIDNSSDCVVGGSDCDKSIDATGQGNLQILAKLRAPFDNLPIDVSLLLGGTISTGRTDYYGLWVRDPALLNIKNKDEDSGRSIPIAEGASTYTNGSSMLKVGSAVTFDFNRIRAEIPLLLHFNYLYRMTLGDAGTDYPSVQSISAAMEWTPSPFISLLGEYYMDMPSAFPTLKDDKEDFAGTSTLTFGTTLHFSKHVDMQLGFQMLLGDEDKYIDNLSIPMNGKTENGSNKYGIYNAALIPKYLAYAGLTFKIFVVEQKVEEEEETRNPDTDGDGVCDPWVARENKQREYAHICKGIDLCPYEEGPIENKGCPEEEVDEDAPTIQFNVDKESVSAGQSATLSWIVTNATEVSIEGFGNVSLKGSKRVNPSETTTYTIIAVGDGGTKKETVEIAVESAPGPSIVFNASPESIQKGQLVTLTWMVSEATEVSIEGIGPVSAKGSKKVKPSDAGVATFTLTATGSGGTRKESIEVEVLGGPLPTILFNASSESITDGQTVTLNWQVGNATEISIEGLGKVPAKGTKKVKPAETTVYKLIAVGEGGVETATVEVEVMAPVIEARVNLQGVTFGSGNATLTPNAKKVLDGVADQLLASPKVKIEIQGHTDNVGKPSANQELSERRAKAVVGYLALKGVSMSRMRAVGFGQDTPMADNKTAEGRELNRRIEMIRVDE